jgi:hypothetical protein
VSVENMYEFQLCLLCHVVSLLYMGALTLDWLRCQQAESYGFIPRRLLQMLWYCTLTTFHDRSTGVYRLN